MSNSSKQLIKYLAQFLMMIGIICLIPLLVLVFYPSEYKDGLYFLIPGFISILIGFIVTKGLKNTIPQKLEKNQDAVLVVFIWILSVFICSFPYYLSGNYNFTNSMFESVSGFSSTGFTIIDVNSLSHIFLFFRSFTQVIGGIGLVLIFTSALSDKLGMRLYTAEGHSDKLMPNLAKSARLILIIYLGYILLGTILYYILGMNMFDAINHSMTAVSTGGFSTKQNSLAYYNSLGIEIVSWILMILGSTNFVVHIFLLTGKFKKAAHHTEIKFFYTVLIIFVSLMTLTLVGSFTTENSFRISMFNFISAITGTGFEIYSTGSLNTTFITFMIIGMLIGGGVGSASGAIKQFRISLLIKSIWWDLKSRVSNTNVVSPKYIARYDTNILVSEKEINDNFTFISVYLFCTVLIAFVFTAFGNNLEKSLLESASILGNVGISTGIIHENANKLIMWIGSFGMFIGRLEILIIFNVVARGFKVLRK